MAKKQNFSNKLRGERKDAENTLHDSRAAPKTEATENADKKKLAHRKRIRHEAASATAREKKLKPKSSVETTAGRPRKPRSFSGNVLSAKGHQILKDADSDENVGTEAAHFAEGSAEAAAHIASRAGYSRKLKKYKRTEKEAVDRLFQESLKDQPQAGSNIFSRWKQRQEIKKNYEAAKAGSSAAVGGTSSPAKAAKETKNVAEKSFAFVKSHSHIILLVLGAALLLLVVSGMFSSCTAIMSGSGNAVIASSFTAEDEDILGSEEDYRAMEEELRREIEEMQEEDDYDEYELNVDEIGHSPWELAALLTVLKEDYTRSEVQGLLRQIFEAQYELSTSTSTETVTETKTVRVGESLGTVTTSGYCNCVICCGQWSGGPTASGVYPTANHTLAVDASNPFVPSGTRVVMNGVEYTVEDTGNFARYGVQFDVYYDSHIAASLHGHKQWECYLADDNGSNKVKVTTTETKRVLKITATNHSLGSVVENMNLTADERERYQLLLQTKGNRSYLFADDIYANATGEYTNYDIPGEALTDVKFRKMITEAEKYLGYPYVWGGSSPSTSFDCSGFVSWVINHCGNGWNVGRQTANGLMGVCDIIPKSEAKPGDLIFFQGTYNTSGASHVGIYVGNGMMIHCGSPISYASIETSYWRQHYYCMGRIK